MDQHRVEVFVQDGDDFFLAARLVFLDKDIAHGRGHRNATRPGRLQ
jgi:hypothetical protein